MTSTTYRPLTSSAHDWKASRDPSLESFSNTTTATLSKKGRSPSTFFRKGSMAPMVSRDMTLMIMPWSGWRAYRTPLRTASTSSGLRLDRASADRALHDDSLRHRGRGLSTIAAMALAPPSASRYSSTQTPSSAFSMPAGRYTRYLPHMPGFHSHPGETICNCDCVDVSTEKRRAMPPTSVPSARRGHREWILWQHRFIRGVRSARSSRACCFSTHVEQYRRLDGCGGGCWSPPPFSASPLLLFALALLLLLLLAVRSR
mmetsp:Transcript_10963/g.25846  ORF Transcript_10963/g.25846 Transcript_10963/m.25846 type:complete len:259 (+) Transcript_10963:1185-1961(+)